MGWFSYTDIIWKNRVIVITSKSYCFVYVYDCSKGLFLSQCCQQQQAAFIRLAINIYISLIVTVNINNIHYVNTNTAPNEN